ncbi:type I-C CRISPR-associated protein Cas8c/Csd1 [Azospirillum halopraeferens]|uniref:type I-C CRISPR-associated protein Cas8c/Csd1 n=1 Tax=Azospirillum halopraeferens TaxID=34010 RepID=UPI0004027982|nr:type I-C CRISPR-associated protein Cas8c/Csd1 [Azospirillum halopraeferens]
MTILSALDAHYRRLEARGDVAPVGFSTETIGFAITLSYAGEPVAVLDLRTGDGRKRTGRRMTVPESAKRSGTKPPPFFLWDNSKYVLGIGTAKGGTGVADYPAHAAAFREFHERLLADTDDDGLRAVLAFLRIRTPEAVAASPFTAEMMDQNLVFRLDGDRDERGRPRFVHDRPAARLVWERHRAGHGGAQGMCLVSGLTGPVARLHPAIKGVWGARTSGASLVSFNLDAFTSYGKEQGDNAPVSEMAARNYGVALNHLLDRDSRNRVQIADASTAFWADAAAGEEKAQRAEALVHAALEPPRPPDDPRVARAEARADAEETRKLREALEQIAAGRAVEEIDPEFDPGTRFHILGLAPNAARLSVRFWHRTTLRDLAARLHDHWADLKIDPSPWKGPPAVRALLFPAALQEKADNIPPLLGGELVRAVLTGGRYPRALLAAVIRRIRAGDPITGARAAICKAVIQRDVRIRRDREARGLDASTYEAKEVPVSLDRNQTDPAYRLGRLFAVLEGVQRAALGRVNASIRDRYFGAASATPASVFPLLLRNANHHLAVLRKDSRTGGLAVWFEREIGDIMGALDMTLPRHLRLEDQGRFAVGYYHQRYGTKATAAESDTPEDLAAADPE